MKQFFEEYFGLIFIAIVILLFLAAIVYTAYSPNLTEGLVMNKRFSPGYLHCADGKCFSSNDRWIIEIQNGERKDWWTVSENYYDSVKIGEWVQK